MEIQCTGCKGDVPIDEQSEFVQCPYCSAALYVDLSKSVLHYYMPAQIEQRDLAPLIRRALTTLEIDAKIEIRDVSLTFFPYWQFKSPSGKTELIAAATPEAEDLFTLIQPAGKKVYCPADFEAQHTVTEPTVLLDQALAEHASRLKGDRGREDATISLNHLPFFHVTYDYEKQPYEIHVEGVTGEVFADQWPPASQRKKNKVLGLVALSSFLIFFIEAYQIPVRYLLPIYGITGAALFFWTRSLLRRLGW